MLAAKRLGILDTIKTSRSIRIAGVSSFRVVGAANIEIIINKTMFPVSVQVVDTQEFDMLLGLDFLMPHRAILDLSQMSLCLNLESSDIVRVPIFSQMDVTLPFSHLQSIAKLHLKLRKAGYTQSQIISLARRDVKSVAEARRLMPLS